MSQSAQGQGARDSKDTTEQQHMDNDKLATDSNADSGFLSSFISSGDIMSEELDKEQQCVSLSEQQAAAAAGDSGKDNSATTTTAASVQNYCSDSGVIADSMHSDSGVQLSESFSNLNVLQRDSRADAKNLNDLNATSDYEKSGDNNANAAEEADKKKTSDYSQDLWKIYYEQDEDGDTQLHLAIVQHFFEVTWAMICAVPHPRLLDTRNDDGHTALHLAAATGQSRVVRWLVVAGARPTIRNCVRGDSPLHIAAAAGDVASCRALTEPVRPEEREQQRRGGQVYEVAAAAKGNNGNNSYELDLDQWNYDGECSIHVAAQHGHLDVVRHLVWCGADVNAREGCSGYTALHYAAMRNDEPLVRYLISTMNGGSATSDRILSGTGGGFGRAILDVEQLTYGGRSALEIEVKGGLSDAVRRAMEGAGVPWGGFDDDEDELEEDSDCEMDNDIDMTFRNSNNVLLVNASA